MIARAEQLDLVRGDQVPRRPVLIIDLRQQIHRHWHGITSGGWDPLSGQPRPVIASSVMKTIRRLRGVIGAESLIAADDCSGPTWRSEIAPYYKANRPEPPAGFDRAVEAVRSALKGESIPVVWAEGYEADDVMASLVKRCKAIERPAVVVTSDKDLLQLVSNRDRVSVWDPAKDQLLDEAAAKERIGVPPRLICDLIALMGDSSDNIGGVPGVGPKTAIKLLRQHGSLWGVLSAAKSEGSKVCKRIADHVEEARLSWRLARLSPAPIRMPDCLTAGGVVRVSPGSEPKCCGLPMVKLCKCVGFRSYGCLRCGRVIDVFECCGSICEIEPEDVGEAAPALCPRCGQSRMGGDRRPNGPGEGAMRASSLGMARARAARVERGFGSEPSPAVEAALDLAAVLDAEWKGVCHGQI